MSQQRDWWKRLFVNAGGLLLAGAITGVTSLQYQMYTAINDIKRSRDVFATEMSHELRSINAKLDGVYTRREAEQALGAIRDKMNGNTESIESNQERIRRLETR